MGQRSDYLLESGEPVYVDWEDPGFESEVGRFLPPVLYRVESYDRGAIEETVFLDLPELEGRGITVILKKFSDGYRLKSARYKEVDT